MKKIVTLIVLVIVLAVSSGYGVSHWALAKNDMTKEVKKTEAASPYDFQKIKTNDINKRVKREMKDRGYKNSQVMALDDYKVRKPEFTDFPHFVEIMSGNWDSALDANIASSYVYAKYLMERTEDESIKKDALSVKEQAKKVILSDYNSAEVKKLRDLFNQLDKKYNQS